MSQRLGDLLLKAKIITPEQLTQALKVQKQQGGARLGSILVKLGYVSDDEVTTFLSRQYGVPAINLSFFDLDPSVVKLVPQETAHRYQVLPLSRVGASLTIAMADPTNVFAIDDVKFMTGFNIEPVVASETAIAAAIEKAYSIPDQDNIDELMASLGEEAEIELTNAEQEELALSDLEKAADEAPIVKLVNLVLTDAVKRAASDIHIEPYEKEYRIRFRIDGVLQTIMSPAPKLKDAITSRIKIMAKLDIAEKRLPQDGRIMMKL
ncbi:MAG TPA: ATPase, T2SS/T4P/T4SS family, partial [Terriglobales bacterium]|nr:ATPase, T2SS/T4P/T4SS family [Terriglobales bacterium]